VISSKVYLIEANWLEKPKLLSSSLYINSTACLETRQFHLQVVRCDLKLYNPAGLDTFNLSLNFGVNSYQSILEK
jgi:hypothetical protein